MTADGTLELLGPVTIRGGAHEVRLTRQMEIGVLAMLALHAGNAVKAQTLINVLWPDDPPPTATKTLQGYIKRVRGLLAQSGIGITHTTPAGYVLEISPGQVDALCFEAIAAEARTCDDDAIRVRQLDSALKLWRGDPFGGCALDGLQPHRAWLLRLRSGVVDERTAADVRLGVSAHTVAAIRSLLIDEPTNERLWLHLAAALYSSGNPAAALVSIADARRQLDEQLGVVPGPELAELARRILAHDRVEQWYRELTGDRRPTGSVDATAHAVPMSMALPQWSGDLIGRDDAVSEIARLIESGGPIITVVGPGGIGKTRCAVEATRRAATPCRGFVDASVTSSGPSLLLQLAGSFGIPDRDDTVSAVAKHLGDGQRGVVVVDNCEQIVDAGAAIAQLADRCPTTVWLVTSRIELGVVQERVVRLAPLDHEPGTADPSPAARLLAAAAERRGVPIARTRGTAIEQVAASIGGIPLALELAACQLQHLEPQALIQALVDPLDTLIDPRQTVIRHRSMRACFQLGFDRLNGDAADLFVLLSQRLSGIRYDDINALWRRTTPLPSAVAELVEVGFATTAPDSTGATRIIQLPLVRAFGQMVERPVELDVVLALDGAVLARAQASTSTAGARFVEPDLPDIRRILQAGVDDDSARELALQLILLLTVYWWSHRITEGRQWFDMLLSRKRPQPSGSRSYAMHAAAFLDFYVGDADKARNRLAAALGDDPVDPLARSRLLSLQAMLDAADDRDRSAGKRAAEAISLARSAGNEQMLSLALGDGGDVALAAGDAATARDRYVECIERLRRSGLGWLSAAPHARLGDLELSAGEHGRARMWFDRSIALWLSRELGPGAPQTLAGLARLEVVEGDLASARRHLDTALGTAERCGSRGEYPWVVLGYAALLAADGRHGAAAQLFDLGLYHGRQAGHRVRRLIDAELRPLHRSVTAHDEAAQTIDPLNRTTALEDLPTLVRRVVAE